MRNYSSMFSHVINYINVVPYLYRYEDTNYIDNFFKNGELYLSSFSNYKKYDDNQLGDTTEGSSFNLAHSDTHTLGTVTSTGFNAYCLCLSILSDTSLLSTFKRNDAFRIVDPINFIIEITRNIPGVLEVLHGNCIYVDNKIIKHHYPGLSIDSFKNNEGSISFDKMMAVSNQVQGADSYFLKKKNYQQQCEYRIIWITNKEIDDGLVINCPEAIKYCEKIEM